jgi:uncharacterized phosphosugar-binding protein
VSALAYQKQISAVLAKIWETQTENIQKASAVMADTISNGGLVHLFGSGHSVLPVQDMFPRYGAYPGFRPLMDMRLMWTNVIGSGGAKGLLWLERREGYAQVLFENEPIRQGDVMLVFSHGGLNAVGIEVLMEAKKRGLTTVAVTSMDNYAKRTATHSSGKKLADVRRPSPGAPGSPSGRKCCRLRRWPAARSRSRPTPDSSAAGLPDIPHDRPHPPHVCSPAARKWR